MKAEVVEGWPKDNKIRIVLSDTNAAQVNSLRRAILADVPKMAITKVRFEQGVTQDNKGEVIESVNVLPDEVLAHRLAMVPVPTFLEEFVSLKMTQTTRTFQKTSGVHHCLRLSITCQLEDLTLTQLMKSRLYMQET